MPSEKKPRELWLFEDEEPVIYTKNPAGEGKPTSFTHVVEYSAVEEALSVLEEIRNEFDTQGIYLPKVRELLRKWGR